MSCTKAGDLKQYLTIQTVTETRDTDGATLQSWSDKAVWGEIKPLSGNEFFKAQQVHSEATHKVKIRYYSGLNSKARIKYGTRYFNILSVINVDEASVFYELLCKEVS